ncbi:MAG TPA: tripartite tricarboxylate transporter substrate binding protein [Burkholderiales bacterium]|jgi:tripartite-type tricarboxylate transporter receptor subunit TctC|nr:tripartite tricarboxylate transporter substrate binding protein [Burkholderiales bacterium]
MMHRLGLFVFGACALLVHIASPAIAQDSYPSRPIRLVILVTPGGGSDVTARTIGQKLTESWGQQVIVDNRPGAGGIVGMEITAKANPDGYTLVLGTIGPVAVNPSLYEKLPYDSSKSFDAVARTVSALNVLVVRPTLPVSSVKELIAYAKANPGKLNFGSSGAGAADHLAGELFNTLAGVRMQHVPYKGGAPAMIDLLGGNVELIFATVSTAVAHLKSGRIRPLAITAGKRTDLFPDIPTVAEAGVPGFAVENWYGVIAPAGVPKPIIGKLHREINRILTLPDVKERLYSMGIVPFPAASPDEFGSYIKAEINKYGAVVKAAGIKPN